LDVAFEWVGVLFLFQDVVCSSLYQGDWLVGVFWWSPRLLEAKTEVANVVPLFGHGRFLQHVSHIIIH
jgi:hypothetical protein